MRKGGFFRPFLLFNFHGHQLRQGDKIMVKLISAGILAAALAFASGCTSTQTGAAVGAGTGAAIGAIATGSGQGALVGAAIGGVTGALIGRAANPGQCLYRYPNGQQYVAPCPR
jgi:hypothetical protein